MLRQLVVFPDSPDLIPSRAIRPTPFRVLVELGCGYIGYMTVTQRTLPTADQFEAIDATLSEGIAAGYPLTHLSDLLNHRHGLAAELLDSRFADIAEWKVANAIQATLASAVSASSFQDMARFREHLHLSAHVRLQDNLNRFLGQLDASTLAALASESLRPSRYNYLTGGTPQLHRNRMQAHSLFPWLMPHVLWNTQLGTLPARLRDAIDRGEPLIDLMAKSFGVTPSVIKSMTHCPLSLLVDSWQGNVKQLAISLHSITPEFRPSTPASWARMGKAVEVIEKGTGQNITRPQNQLWLAASARRGFDMKAVEPGDVAALTQALADMSNALHEVLAMRIGGAQSWHAGWSQRNEPVMESIRRVVSRAMSHVEFSKLLDLVRRWQDAFRRAQTIQDQDSELIRGLTWRSPVDEYANDSRIIVPLLSQPDLIEEGRAMNHCVGGYTCDCRLGKLQIWSIRTLEGQRCSTLATEFKRSPDGRWKATINQHRGHSNATPDKATIRAAHELLGNLSANDADLQQFWEWRRTLAQLSVKERGILIATRTLERSLQDALPRKLSLDILESDIRQSLQTVSASTRQTLSDDRTCRPRSMPLTA